LLVDISAPARPGADKNEPPNEIASLGYDFLSNHAADGPAKEVDLGKPESLNEGDGVCGHLLNTRRHLTRTARNTCVIEKNHLAVLGQAVGYGRIPVIHSPGVMRAEDERHAAAIAETAIGEADSIGLDELRRRGLMGVGGHDRSPNVAVWHTPEMNSPERLEKRAAVPNITDLMFAIEVVRGWTVWGP
jgi:hypothetical protein